MLMGASKRLVNTNVYIYFLGNRSTLARYYPPSRSLSFTALLDSYDRGRLKAEDDWADVADQPADNGQVAG